MDTQISGTAGTAFDWRPQPAAAAFVWETVTRFLADSPALQRLADQMRVMTGTRLIDWIDHVAIPHSDALVRRLSGLGFGQVAPGRPVWRHAGGLFPAVRLMDGRSSQVALRVESVSDFLFAHGLELSAIDGAPLSSLRRARLPDRGGTIVSVIERHGNSGFDSTDEPVPVRAVLHHGEAFLRRRRHFAAAEDGFANARTLIADATADLGADRTADLFFSAERIYWMSRNRAAQVQKARQDRLGLGWANHDHHTYRSSREHFVALIGVFDALGLACRERFYAGEKAGWGAQVMEQPAAGIVVFADVDLAPDEIVDDFAHRPLAARGQLGTAGLWCALHGEAFLEAGMHHLECQFDFGAEREQLRNGGVGSMAPFTFFPYLKQAFTEPEIWPVDQARIESLRERGLISSAQADQFRQDGAVGSHLEVLQRDDGYKGFNQSGINEIMRRTDPRQARLVAAGA